MLRKIICIDEEKCIGCGLCAKACHEGAIEILDGKAKLVREHFCDGFGDCLPNCPVGAIHFEHREAPAYDEQAVLSAKRKEKSLNNWPIQIKLSPLQSPSFQDASLVIAADCCGFAYKNMFEKFVKGNVVLIGCSKLDNIDYSEKLTEIIRNNSFSDITVVKMEVPCCNGLFRMTEKALENSGKTLALNVETITIHGDRL